MTRFQDGNEFWNQNSAQKHLGKHYSSSGSEKKLTENAEINELLENVENLLEQLGGASQVVPVEDTFCRGKPEPKTAPTTEKKIKRLPMFSDSKMPAAESKAAVLNRKVKNYVAGLVEKQAD